MTLDYNQNIKDINAWITANHPHSFPEGIDEKTALFHRKAFVIDTHIDSISLHGYFGSDFAGQRFRPDWSRPRSWLAMLLLVCFPRGKNKPLNGHVFQSDIVNGGFGGGCFSAHANIENVTGCFGRDPWEKVAVEYRTLLGYLSNPATGFRMKLCTSAQQAIAAKKKQQPIAIFSVEGAHVLGRFGRNEIPKATRLERLVALKRKYGAAYLTLDHYCQTDISHSGFPLNKWFCAKTHDAGLSEFGRDIVTTAFREGLLIDLSHSTTASITEVCEIAREFKVPVFASHSGSQSIAANGGSTKSQSMRRMMEDIAIKEIVSTNGCISVGINPFWLRNDGEKDGPLSLFIGHYEKLAQLIAQLVPNVKDPWDHLSFGTDFDGGIAALPQELRGGRDLPLITLMMLQRGWSERRIEKVYSGNFLRVWQAAESRSKQLNHPKKPATPQP